MNERIKELAKNDLVRSEYTEFGSQECYRYEFEPAELQRFVQLIVKECLDKIETHRIPVGNSAAGEMACEWTYDALNEISDEIREHFGVEE